MSQQVVNLVLVQLVVFTSLGYALLQSISDFSIQALDVEVHIALVEVFKHFGFCLDVSVDPKECRDLFLLNVHQIFVGQVLQQNMASLSPVLSQPIQNTLLLLN